MTLPILLLTPLSIGPGWATDTLAFLLSRIGYAVVGVTLIMTRKHADEYKDKNKQRIFQITAR